MSSCQSKPLPRKIVVDLLIIPAPGYTTRAYRSLLDWKYQRGVDSPGKLIWVDRSVHAFAATSQSKLQFLDF